MNKKIAQTYAKNVGFYLVAALLFGLSYRLLPLFSENQNTYMLQAYAAADYGFLKNDWVAQTPTSVPWFSMLVLATVRYADPALFYIYHLILLTIYLYSIQHIAFMNIPLPDTRYNRLVFFFFLTVIHSYLLAGITLKLFGMPVSYAFYSGVAVQHVISGVFQPSDFGVFFLLAILLFLKRHYIASAFALAVASYNSSYLIIGAVLTAIFMLLLFWEEKKLFKPLKYGAFMLLLVLPNLYYVATTFQPTTEETLHQANEILLYYRGSHHSLPNVWLNKLDLVRLSLVLAGLYLTHKRNTRLFVILLLGLLFVVSTTVLQYWKREFVLGSVYPWRVSVLLVPISMGILLTYLMDVLWERLPKRLKKTPRWVYAGVAVEIIVMFIWIAGIPYGKSSADLEPPSLHASMDYIRDHKTAEDVYLIPVYMENLRLYTGAPIFVDSKSVPLPDTNIVEWYKRHQLAVAFYDSKSCDDLDKILTEYRITHILIDAELACPDLEIIYQQQPYFLYKIEPASANS